MVFKNQALNSLSEVKHLCTKKTTPGFGGSLFLCPILYFCLRRLVADTFCNDLLKAIPKPKVTNPPAAKTTPKWLLSLPVFGTEKVAVANGSVGVVSGGSVGVFVGVPPGSCGVSSGGGVDVLVGVFVGVLEGK